jgi:glycosyltransferase involved in cell wall biosynthesis
VFTATSKIYQKRSLRIGVDATCWGNARGYGRHARGLLSTLVHLDQSNRYAFFLDSEAYLPTLPPEAEIRLVRSSMPTTVAASTNGHRSLADLWRMSRALSGREFDLLLFPTIYSYVPVFSRAKKIVMIHDVIAEKYPDLTVPRSAARFFWKTKVAMGRWQADAVATVSDYSRRGIMEHFGLSADKVFVVGEANDPAFCTIDDPQPSPRLRSLGVVDKGRFIIYVGGFGPHKNLEALIETFAKLSKQSDFTDARLVMVGEYEKEVFHSYFTTIKRLVETAGLKDRVIFTGYLPDDELAVLLNLSTVLVLPSLMEGFGLPAIEAAACGCPVIATRESPIPKLLSDGGIYIDPGKPGDLELALTSVLQSPMLRQQMGGAGLAAAGRLTWDAAARQMIDVMQQVVTQ